MDKEHPPRLCIVTGANSGIGKETAKALAGRGDEVVIACRNKAKAQAAEAEILARHPHAKLHSMTLDLASPQSIRTFSASVLERFEQIHVLVNNAGVWTRKRKQAADGSELIFYVNHFGPFLLTQLLLDRIKASAPARIINVSSAQHNKGRINFGDLDKEQRFNSLQAYSDSKLANVLFTYELARRLEGTGVAVNALHPGVVYTGIARELPRVLQAVIGLFLLSPEKGAATSIYLASSPQVEGATGGYYVKCAPARSSPLSHNPELAAKLWEVSEERVGLN